MHGILKPEKFRVILIINNTFIDMNDMMDDEWSIIQEKADKVEVTT